MTMPPFAAMGGGAKPSQPTGPQTSPTAPGGGVSPFMPTPQSGAPQSMPMTPAAGGGMAGGMNGMRNWMSQLQSLFARPGRQPQQAKQPMPGKPQTQPPRGGISPYGTPPQQTQPTMPGKPQTQPPINKTLLGSNGLPRPMR